MTTKFRPGDRVTLCPVVESVNGDMVTLVFWDGLRVPIWDQFLQPVPDIPYAGDIPDFATASAQNAAMMARLRAYGRIPE